MPIKNKEKRKEYENRWCREKRAGIKGDDVREYHKEYMKEWRRKNPDKVYDSESYENRKQYHKEYREKNKDKLKKQRKEYYEKNKEYFKKKAGEHYIRNKDKVSRKSLEKRIKILNHYGNNNPRCMCCGETIIEFLALDHIHNDGAKHRKEIKSKMYDWIIKNEFPEDIFQILCHNCNLAKGFYGTCPHNAVKQND